jgi:hypothetical protein
MRYLVTTTDGNKPFITNWFDSDIHFIKKSGMIVYDLYFNRYIDDTGVWNVIIIDSL